MSLVTRIAFLFAAISLLTPAAVFARPPQTASPEGQLFNSLNRERAAQGLPVLQWDEALASAARQHAGQMAQLNLMSHQLPGEPNCLRAPMKRALVSALSPKTSPSVPTPAIIHTAWMHSPGHRANILSPELTAVGIAVVQGNSGLFAAQDFSRNVRKFESRSAGAASDFATGFARLASHCFG